MSKYKVIFIGNSYTYYNDMPSVFSDIAASMGYEVEVCSVTKGGEKLLGHVDEKGETYPQILAELKKSRFDFAVLQEQSIRPVIDPPLFFDGGKRLSELLSDRVDRLVLYATWARRWDSGFYSEHPMTVSEMTEKLDSAYSALGEMISAKVSHVGRSFERVGSDALYDADASHPSYLGSCLAALVLARTVLEVSDREIAAISRIGELSDAETELIKKAVTG